MQHVGRRDGHKGSNQTAFPEPQSLSARRPAAWPTPPEVIEQRPLFELAGGTPLKGSHLDRSCLHPCVSLMFFLRVSRGRGRPKLYETFRTCTVLGYSSLRQNSRHSHSWDIQDSTFRTVLAKLWMPFGEPALKQNLRVIPRCPLAGIASSAASNRRSAPCAISPLSACRYRSYPSCSSFFRT